MAQIALVTSLMEIGKPESGKILPCLSEYHAEIRVTELAAIRIDDIIKAFLLVQPQGERTVLHHIPEGKLHLVAIAENLRRREYGFVAEVRADDRAEQFSDLRFLLLQLFLIGDTCIEASAADTGILTLNRMFFHGFPLLIFCGYCVYCVHGRQLWL